MRSILRHPQLLLALLALPILAGCPSGGPALNVSPLALSFGPSSTIATFTIANAGGGSLNYTASTSVPWLKITVSGENNPQSSITGTTSTDVVLIQARLDRALLPEGAANTAITITSNGGSQNVLVSATTSSQAQFTVTPAAVDFGQFLGETELLLRASSGSTVNWSLGIPAGVEWLRATPQSGTLSTTTPTNLVDLSVRRELLGPGTFNTSLTFTSNAGSVVVPVSVINPSWTVTPQQVDFGTIFAAAQSTLSFLNNDFDPIPFSVSITTNDGQNWLRVSPDAAAGAPDTPTVLTVTADPAGLAPGLYAGQITVNASQSPFTVNIPVAMEVGGFQVSPSEINFGRQETTANETLTLTNLGLNPIDFTLDSTGTIAPFLTFNSDTGTIAAGTSVQRIVQLNATNATPGDYSGSIVVRRGAQTTSLPVSFTKPTPPGLQVVPQGLSFGTALNVRNLAIFNPGEGSVNWSIDLSNFPVWLSVDGAGSAASLNGTVSGETTDNLTLRVNRALAPVDRNSFNFTFNVVASGDFAGSIPVNVTMQIAVFPDIDVETEDRLLDGTPVIDFGEGFDFLSFVIRNTGRSNLTFTIDNTNRPTWITAINPSQGTLAANTQLTVTVQVSRAGLNFGPRDFRATILSNDPDEGAIPLVVELQVPKRARIGVADPEIAFGPNQNVFVSGVANFGDPDTELRYRVTADEGWLSALPSTGVSVGTLSPFKDFQLLDVAVDRSRLDRGSATARLRVEAIETVNGAEVVDPDIEPVEILVSVEAADLTLENSATRLRIPSLARTVILPRNVRYQLIPFQRSDFGRLAEQFLLTENAVAVERTESNQFVTSGANLKTNLVLLLDYSGSMLESILAMNEPGISDAADPVQALYERVIPPLILGLPDNYRVAIAVFNDINSAPLIALDGPNEPYFVTDKTRLLNRLNGIFIQDNGASPIFPAIESVSNVLVYEDQRMSRTPFDDADVRAVVCITDGRVTTPPGSITDTINRLILDRTRVFAIGWGNNVSANTLVQLATGSGGHYYSTANREVATGNPANPTRVVPALDELLEWCETDPTDDCDQSVVRDLTNQIVLSYTSLNQEPTVTLRGSVRIDDPTDACIGREQGEVNGSFVDGDLPYEVVSGDPRLGQISLRTEGIQPDGTARIIVRLEYMPRSLNSLTMSLLLDSAEVGATQYTVSRIPETEGGVFFNLTPTVVNDEITFTNTGGAPFQYGLFGDMFAIDVTGVTQAFTALFDVVSPVFIPLDRNVKYFTHPDTMPVPEIDSFFASALPALAVDSVLGFTDVNPLTIEIPDGQTSALLNLHNIGGSHTPTDLRLIWSANGIQGAFDFIPDSDDFGLASTTENQPVEVLPDFTGPPGPRTSRFNFIWGFSGYLVSFDSAAITLKYRVPFLQTTTPEIIIPAPETEAAVSLFTTATRDITWDLLDPGSVPSWLSLSKISGTIARQGADEVLLQVDRTGLALPAQATLLFKSPFDSTPRTIQVSVL